MNYPLGTWQELNWNSSYSDPQFWWFCGNVTDPNTPENITSVDHLLANYTDGEPWVNLGAYANYFQNEYLVPLCPSGDYASNDCFGTQNRECLWLFVAVRRTVLIDDRVILGGYQEFCISVLPVLEYVNRPRFCLAYPCPPIIDILPQLALSLARIRQLNLSENRRCCRDPFRSTIPSSGVTGRSQQAHITRSQPMVPICPPTTRTVTSISPDNAWPSSMAVCFPAPSSEIFSVATADRFSLDSRRRCMERCMLSLNIRSASVSFHES